MSANLQEQSFVHSYSKVLVQAWTDSNYKSLLESNPAAALSQYGLVTQPGANIKIVEDVAGQGNLTDQYKAWQEGQQTGSYTLYVIREWQQKILTVAVAAHVVPAPSSKEIRERLCYGKTSP